MIFSYSSQQPNADCPVLSEKFNSAGRRLTILSPDLRAIEEKFGITPWQFPFHEVKGEPSQHI